MIIKVCVASVFINNRQFEIANNWNSIDNHVAFPKCIYVLKMVKKWLNGTKNYKILV
jgi:hypothetical protein